MTLSIEPGGLVSARGREWVVLPGTTEDALVLRPLTGTEADRIVLLPDLEPVPPTLATFAKPDPAATGTSAEAELLADALRLSLRRGAGPFRSAGRIAFQPRAYQLVPLIMALRQETIRLLVADDVGIGKTVEAGLVLREMWDRGEVLRAAVLCPPHLVEQWVDELRDKFDLAAVPVTAASAARLERGLGVSESLFDVHPLTVISLDYIKAENRREKFRRECPRFVIVDEAHACVGTSGSGRSGATQRFGLLSALAKDPERHLVMLTATPHSGDTEAFDNLLGLIDPSFTSASLETQPTRERLARHFVQRRRADVEEGWDEDENSRVFPLHKDRPNATYRLSRDHLAFHDAVLDYCLGVTKAAGPDERRRHVAFWGTLALMRCVGSSPAAALSALKSRRDGRSAEEADAETEAAVFDEDDTGLTDDDLEPALEPDWDANAVGALIDAAQRLVDAADATPKSDPKLGRLIAEVTGLLELGARPVVFCRFIATAEAVGSALAKTFRSANVEVVTGRLPPPERRRAVAAMEAHPVRILVATDCLSEGINLQNLFDAVVHYDLSWNPTRHQQRVGRVNRFGQPSPAVYSILLFAENSAIDGAVLSVIVNKAEAIRKATGVSIAMPENHEKVSAALMQAVLLRSGRSNQFTFDFGDAVEEVDTAWRNAEENEKRSRARFAQNRLKPAEVLPEWQRAGRLLGSPADVDRFTRRALARLGAPLGTTRRGHVAHLAALPEGLRETLRQKGLAGDLRVAFDQAPPEGVAALHRAHPLVATLADHLAERALDGGGGPGTLARCGAWPAKGVATMVTLALLRIRHRIARRRQADFLLAEEIVAVAFEGTAATPTAIGDEALAHFAREATGTLPERVRTAQITQALMRLDGWSAALTAVVQERAHALGDDHDRLRAAAAGTGARTDVDPVLPPDLVGVWVLLPET